MKKHSTYLFLIILLALLGCEKDSPIDREEYEGEDNVNIELSTELISFSPGGGTEEITVNTGGSEWSVSSNKTWCVVSKEAGKITITAAANDEEVDREDATVTVTSGNVSRSIIIRQSGTKSGNISYTISDETKFLTSADMSNISEGEGWDKLVYTSGTPVDELPVKDNILLLSTPTKEFPYGFVKRVVDVGDKSDDGSVVVTTIDVPFEKAFDKLEIETTGLDLTNYVDQIIDANGNQLPYTRTRAVSQGSLSITLPSDLIEFGGQDFENIKLSPSIDINLGMRLQTVVYEKELLTFNLLVDPDISLGADFTIEVGNKKELVKDLMTIYMNPIPVGPIIITPYVRFSALVRFDGSISLTASISYDHALTVGAKYETGDWNAIYRDRSGESDASPIKYGSTIDIEGGVGVGVKTTVGFGLYGNLLSGNLEINTLLRGSGNVEIDLGKPIERYWLLTNMNLLSEFLIDADISLSVMDETIAEEEIPGEISIPIDTLYLIPELQEQVNVNVNGRNVDIELECKRRSLFDMKIIGEVFIGNTGDKFEIEFQPEGGTYKPVNNSQSVKLTKRLTNLEDETYIIDLFMVVEGNKMDLNKEIKFTLKDETVTAAAKAILSDIYYSAGGSSWSGCNWFKPGVEIDDFECVNFYKSDEAYELIINLNQYEEWKLTGDMKIGNHTANVNLIMWYINGENDCQSIVVDDMKCKSVGDLFYNSNLERIEVHSPHFYDFSMSSISTNIIYIDLSGTAIKEIAPEKWVPRADYQPVPVKLREVYVDNCRNLERIHLDGGTAYTGNTDFKLTLSANNCPKMKLLQLDSLNIDLKGEFDANKISMNNSSIAGEVSLSSSQLLKEIYLSFKGNRFINKLRIANNPLLEYVNIDFDRIDETIEVGIDELTLLNCNSLLDFKLNNLGASTQSLVRSLNVANCNNLDWLDASALKLQQLSLSNLPALTRLFVQENSLTGLMLPIFDEVRGRENAWVNYDERYYYEESSSSVDPIFTDRGVGYWYDGEPDRGYHRK